MIVVALPARETNITRERKGKEMRDGGEQTEQRKSGRMEFIVPVLVLKVPGAWLLSSCSTLFFTTFDVWGVA